MADELHKPIRRRFEKRRVFVKGIDEIWAADLVDMKEFEEENGGVKFLLSVFDVFSKFGWMLALKNKSGESVALALKEIFKERKPKFLWTDKGKEFWNSKVKNFLKENGVKLYSTENEEKISVLERWNRTMKEKMWKMFTERNSWVFVDKLDDLVKKYNRTKHGPISMTPISASRKQNEKVFAKLFGKDILKKRKKPKFKVGDRVRIGKKKKTFEKGFTPNWSEEIFVVDQVIHTNPVTFKLVDLMGEEVTGSFYGEELQKTNQEVFRVEKGLFEENGKSFVKWKGYSDKYNEWIPDEWVVELK